MRFASTSIISPMGTSVPNMCYAVLQYDVFSRFAQAP